MSEGEEVIDNQEVKVQQGEHSFIVTRGQINRYSNSFLAGWFRVPENYKKFTVSVEERNVEFFPFIEQLYKKNKIRLLETNVAKGPILEELRFWFTDTPIDIKYKDPIVELEYSRAQAIMNQIKQKREMIVESLNKAAQSGYNDCHFDDKSGLPFPTPGIYSEYSKIYNEVLAEIFPNDKITVDLIVGIITIQWDITQGKLGQTSLNVMNRKCKILWKDLYAISLAHSFNGYYTHELNESDTDYYVRNSNFQSHFIAYVNKKSTNMKIKFNRNVGHGVFHITLTLRWGIKTTDFFTPSAKKQRVEKEGSHL